jgi:hypothetical protein
MSLVMHRVCRLEIRTQNPHRSKAAKTGVEQDTAVDNGSFQLDDA